MNELQKEIIDQVAKFCQKQMAPFISEDDRNENFRMEIFRGLGELGVCGLTLPEKYEGLGLKYQDLTLVLQEIAKTSVPYAVTISVSTMVQSLINEFGNDQQKENFLPELTSGKEIGAFALSESESGSDASSLSCQAKKVDGGYELTGNKLWITSGGIAKTYLVMARTGEAGPKGITCFIVQDGAKGFSYGKLEEKMGWKISPTRELVFENCFIPENQVLGEVGGGFKLAMSALDKGRITIGAIAVGLSMQAFDEAMRYSLTRKQFGKNIFSFQGIQFLLAELATEIKASELLVKESARTYDENIPNPKLASMAKLKATDVAMKVTTDAIQILGGVGYTKEYPLERFMRDAKVLQIVEGTNQIQKVVMAKHLQKEYQ